MAAANRSKRHAWRYEGVLHEFLSCVDRRTAGTSPTGARKRLSGARSKWAKKERADDHPRRNDIERRFVFENALQTETDPFLVSRYKFYLAQSYRDAGEKKKALQDYQDRSKLGFWNQEILLASIVRKHKG